MIKNIIFDFGDIFINLDKTAVFKKMAAFGYTEYTDALDLLCKEYEMGLMSSEDFLAGLKEMYPEATETDLLDAWNSILLDFPEHRLAFIENLKAQESHRLFLLSNTNDLHIEYVKKTMGQDRFDRFKNCFEGFYLSQQIKMRKPNSDIYEHVLKNNALIPQETLFIDDTKANTDSAEKLGIRCWNLQVGKEEITELNKRL
ncbi:MULTISPECIES: HAD family hydrolase [Maribacter]|uniref:HAD family phosphatase n=1 Tax=Maribacter flavus TaxID=1658664 RepID=A0ABU7IJU2_9FLAO|nr:MULTISPECIES: HAD family phosphatase [Maribacter]MDC6405983.1 HAD family phosphatase [Maribacter sp. PR66]MEE1973232.1 HAD family phosphatase [Maribacter flavus]